MASNKAAAAALAAAQIAARSIHIKIHPTARSIPERREILRVLERFGEVEMFRSLKYDITPVPNAFLSILSSPEAAQQAIDASPIRYRLVTDHISPRATPDQPLESTPDASTEATSGTTTSAAPPSTTFEIRISPSAYPHRISTTSSALYGPWTPILHSNSPIAADLATRIPSSIHKDGLCDWVTEDLLRAPNGTSGALRRIRKKAAGKMEAAEMTRRSTMLSLLRGERTEMGRPEGEVEGE